MINSRRIEDLDPLVQPIALAHVRQCSNVGIDIIVTSTFRDAEQQTELYLIGRTPNDTRLKVTNAKAYESWHNFRCAWDVVPVIGGKCVWEDPVLWSRVINIGEAVGAEAGAKWLHFPDRPHFQVIPKSLSLIGTAARAIFENHGSVFI